MYEKSAFNELYAIPDFKHPTKISEVTNSSWPEETIKAGVITIMQKDSEGKWKKTVNLSKEECGKLALMLTEISEK